MRWKNIPNYPGYRLSEDGRLFSLKTNKMLKPAKTPHGYVKYTLGLGSRTNAKQIEVQRLVAMTFIGPIPPRYTVNHLDGNKENNHVSNLEIVTHRENIMHAVRTGLRRDLSVSQNGENNPNARLTEAQIREILDTPRTIKAPALAARYGVSASLINLVRQRRIWRHLSVN